MDPNNPIYFPNERFKNSLADIPGEKPLIHSLQDVPHGSVTFCSYFSRTFANFRSLVIYTPPGYEENRNKKYPVFYLISGTTDTEETYFKVGRINFILDNLISQQEAIPMIIVMPYGNPEQFLTQESAARQPSGTERDSIIGHDLLHDIIPYIEENYRVYKDKDNRAIGGFSRGGGQTLRIGLAHPELFSWICCYSAYLGREEFEKDFKIV
jgi:enterochelin esterase family protein